jgi:large subunit ribosomal protein L16
MLQPRRIKHRKVHRGRRAGKATGGNQLNFGQFGLKAQEAGWISARQIEAARVVMTRHLRRGGDVWIRLFPDKSVTKKAAETRMGGGKANVDHWVAVVKPGRVMFELAGVRAEDAMEAMRLASHKLPIATRAISREEIAT